MYESFYGFKEKPFQIIPDPNFLYLSPNHELALKNLEYGVERNVGMFLLTGEVGSGKTTLIKHLSQQFGQNIELAIISNTNLHADQLLSFILIELGIEHSETNKAQNLTIFKNYLKYIDSENQRTILIIDEAQNLPKDALEELRMLSNFQSDAQMPLQIFLVGQPELRNILNSPGMNQIRQRISVNYHLKGLNFGETKNYIAYRLRKVGCKKEIFTLESIELIHKAAAGIPRTINQLCDSALLYGFADEMKTIGKEVINNLLKDLDFKSVNAKESIELNPAEHPNKAINRTNLLNEPIMQTLSDLMNKITILIKEPLDKIDIKLDQLRNDIRNFDKDSLAAERKRYEELLVENTKIKIEYERVTKENLKSNVAKFGKRTVKGHRLDGDRGSSEISKNPNQANKGL